MSTPRRLLALRLIAILALVASGALTSDALRPNEHGFCPLEQACAKARSSALGSVLGVPTSGFGMMAFGGLLLLTLLPPVAARAALRPAGLLAALAGVALVAYQALILKSFCPLCLVADASGLAAGVAVLAWEAIPLRKDGRGPPGELMDVRLRWALVGGLAIAGPLLWPHAPPRPSWVPIPEAAALEVAEIPAPGPALAPTPPLPMPTLGPPEVPDFTPRWEPLRDPPKIGTPLRGETPPPEPAGAARPAPLPPRPVPAADPVREAVATPDPAPAPAPAPPSAPVRASEPAAVVAPAPQRPSAPAEIRLVEYLNPFCAHCRATHARLDRILSTSAFPVRRRRLYVWASGDPPLWARACACAAAQGKEEVLFGELLRAEDQEDESVWAAARRADVDMGALTACMGAGGASRLDSERQRVLASRIEGLPTLDVGRRRLQGEQSEDELTDALLAAQADIRAGAH